MASKARTIMGSGLPIYKSGYVQRGRGIGGSLTSNLFKYAIPFIKPVAKSLFEKVKQHAIKGGINLAQDVLIRRRPITKSLKRRGRQTLKSIFNQKGRGMGGCRKRASPKRGKKRKRTVKRSVRSKRLKSIHRPKNSYHKNIFS